MDPVLATPSDCRSRDTGVLGGVFGLAEPWPLAGAREDTIRPFQGAGCWRLANASSAFWLVARALQPGKVWLPSFLCDSVVRAFLVAGVGVEFFPVDERLHVVDGHWVERVMEGDLVVRIHYFGFRNSDPVFEAAKARGAWLMDDAAQALLTREIGHDSDFVVYSPRKFVGVPDGGVLVARKPFEPRDALLPAPAEWWLEAFSAVLLRRDHDQSGASGDWFRQFQHSEATAPIGPFSMSTLSAGLLSHNFNYGEIAERRRLNYSHLSERLRVWACYPELPDGVVPLGFPLRLHNRDEVRGLLCRRKIFPPVHWPVDGVVPDTFTDSHQLAREIMTLPCDQRYDLPDMERMADCFLKAR